MATNFITSSRIFQMVAKTWSVIAELKGSLPPESSVRGAGKMKRTTTDNAADEPSLAGDRVVFAAICPETGAWPLR